MKIIAALTAVLFLASCGVDGEPIRPSAGIGIGIGPNGLSTSAKVGASKGNVSVGVSL
ncbi:hypothetical protein [Cognatishimia activa]|uniref:hypothetical protein n=1 Tax=Cognatishimia activa TaxID=1715691 RepID=UPI0022313354|nr:hypothetical protein [Cognatishimia activa]UZD90171.1 hypothetical protein M0D42_11310 [Cognatishimia activa]